MMIQIMKTLFTAEAVSKGGRSGTIQTSDGLTLLLTQTEALSYATHLAQVAAQNEPQPDRAQALAGVGKDMANLYHEVFSLLLAK